MNKELTNSKLSELIKLITNSEPELINDSEIEQLRKFLEDFYEEITSEKL